VNWSSSPTARSLSVCSARLRRHDGREIVVFGRAEDWHLIATKLDLRGALLGERPSPADELWLRDADILIVPKSPIVRVNDFIELVFTRGVYGAIPFNGVSIGFAKLSSI
jgi:polysaccharide export outer membrane protein